VLAWIRARTGSVYPGMLLHASFNLVALVAAVTIGG
jgi:membrane protease YdiL (CAAX protease family)